MLSKIAGISSLVGLSALAADEYTIVLHPPTLSPGQQRGYTDAAAAAFSFLEGGNGADFSITLHGTDESAEDAKAAITSLARAESQRAQQEAADFQAEKALIGGGSFLEPLGLLGAQKASQASLPTQVNVNFQPGKTSFVEDAGRDTVLTLDLPAAFVETPEDANPEGHSKLFTQDQVRQITERLTKNEIPVFHRMLADMDKLGVSNAGEALTHLVQDHLHQVESLKSEAHLTTSFVNSKNAGTVKANACNYGRLLAQASYAMVNVAGHIITVMTSVACGCVYAGEFGMCILQKAAPIFPICEAVQGVQKSVFAGSQSAWEAVKATTKTCDMPPSF